MYINHHCIFWDNGFIHLNVSFSFCSKTSSIFLGDKGLFWSFTILHSFFMCKSIQMCLYKKKRIDYRKNIETKKLILDCDCVYLVGDSTLFPGSIIPGVCVQGSWRCWGGGGKGSFRSLHFYSCIWVYRCCRAETWYVQNCSFFIIIFVEYF